jgi:hypothetical protein
MVQTINWPALLIQMPWGAPSRRCTCVELRRREAGQCDDPGAQLPSTTRCGCPSCRPAPVRMCAAFPLPGNRTSPATASATAC